MEQLEQFLNSVRTDFPTLISPALNLITAFAILIIGWIVARWAKAAIRKPLRRAHEHIDATLRPVIASAVFYAIVAMTLYAFLAKLGVPATSLLAVFGAAGLAIGLALKDTLSNIASGIMLLMLRPLAVGDYIDTSSAAGTVEEVGLFSTTLVNSEGIRIFVPNSQVWSQRIQNFGRHKIRKAIIDIGVGYGSDLEVVKSGLLGLLAQTPDVLDLPSPPEVFVMNFAESAIILSCRCWLPADNWLTRASDLRMAIKSHLDKEKIEIPFPQRVMHQHKNN